MRVFHSGTSFGVSLLLLAGVVIMPRAATAGPTRGGFLEVGVRRRADVAVGRGKEDSGLGDLEEPSAKGDEELIAEDAPGLPAEIGLSEPRRLAVVLAEAGKQESWTGYLRSFFGARDKATARGRKQKLSQARMDEWREGDDDEEDEEIVRIGRTGALADKNNDRKVSAEELFQFAEQVRERRRRKMTKEGLRARDTDRNGRISLAEIETATARGGHDASGRFGRSVEQARRKFQAADQDGDGSLVLEELHGYLHPETQPAVLEIEAEIHFRNTDHDQDGRVSLVEFLLEAQKGEDEAEQFSVEDVTTDFHMYDLDDLGSLDQAEFAEYLRGQVLLRQHVEYAVKAGDGDADGQIHLDEELPYRKEEIMDSEFVEDYLLFHRRDEL